MRTILLGLLAAGLAFGPLQARASTSIDGTLDAVKEIRALEILGKLYNVRFTCDTFPNLVANELPAFFNDEPGVQVATPAVVDYLEAIGATRLDLAGTECFRDFPFEVQINFLVPLRFGAVPGSLPQGYFASLCCSKADLRKNVFGPAFFSDAGKFTAAFFTETTPAQLITYLAEAVENVGPGSSLADKLANIAAYYQAGDLVAACAALEGFEGQVHGLARAKRLDGLMAEQLLEDADQIREQAACP